MKKEVTLSFLIRNLIANYPEANPFCDEFDIEKFNGLLTSERDIVSKDITIIDADVEQVIVEAMIEFNELYVDIMDYVEDLFDSINLTAVDLIEYVLAMTNAQFLSAREAQLEQRFDEKVPAQLSVNEWGNVSLKTIDGRKVLAQDAIDTMLDNCAKLIEVILSLRKRKVKTSTLVTDQNHADIVQALLYINVMLGIQASFESYVWELATLKGKDRKFEILDNELYRLLKAVGREREANHMEERASMIALEEEPVASYRPHISSLGGQLNLQHKLERIPNGYHPHVKATNDIYFKHLDGFVIPSFKKLTIKELGVIIAELRLMMNNLPVKQILDFIDEKHSLKNVPIKVNKKNLVSYIENSTGLEYSTIERVITLLSKMLEPETNFWRTPFLRINDTLYFPLASISQGHSAYLIDCILDRCSDLNAEADKFFRHVRDFCSNLNLGDFKFSVVPDDRVFAIIESKDPVVVVEMKTTVIVLLTCIYRFPIDPREYHAGLDRVGEASIKLRQTIRKIKQHPDFSGKTLESFVGVVVTNHVSFSGMPLNGYTVLDLQLLANYFEIGKFSKGMVIAGNGKRTYKEVASYEYYKDEDQCNEMLKNFCLDPFPVSEAMKFFRIKNFRITPENMLLQVFGTGVERRTLKEAIEGDMSMVQHHLQQLYYFEKEFSDTQSFSRKYLDSQLDFWIPKVFNFVAMNRDERGFRIEFLKIFSKVGTTGVSQLIYFFDKALHELSGKPFAKERKEENDWSESDDELAEKHLKQIFASLQAEKPEDGEVNLVDVEIKHFLNDEELKNLLNHLRDVVSAVIPKYFEEKQLDNMFFIVMLYGKLGIKSERERKNVYTVFLNFVDVLNYNHLYQKARNFGETALDLSIKLEDIPVLGWLTLFKCYLKQKNVTDSAFYGNLYLAAVNAMPALQQHHVVDGMYNAMLLFRTYGYSEIADQLFVLLKQFEFSRYDEQKILLSYYNNKLLTLEDLQKVVPEVNAYLKEQLDGIRAYGQIAVMPWIGFVYNLVNLKDKKLIDDILDLPETLKVLEAEVDEVTLLKLRAQFFPLSEQTKTIFKNSLAKVFETKFYDDFSHELGLLELMAKNNVIVSLEPLDESAILLSGVVLNDNRLTFKEDENKVLTGPFLTGAGDTIIKKLEEYGQTILSEIQIGKRQLACWMFNIYSSIYLLTINSDKSVKVHFLDGFDLTGMRKWIDSIDEFTFELKKDASINEQEALYANVLTKLQGCLLRIDEEFDELLFSASLDLASMPHNLLQIRNGLVNIDQHEYLIKQQIEKTASDFIAFHKSIVNVISLEWFAQNSNELRFKEISIEGWIPLDDGDFVLAMGYERLVPIIENLHKGKIKTAVIPKKPVSATINVFMAHGMREEDGFRAIYTREAEGEGHAVVNEKTASLFGTGTIAVLFICSSAAITRELYAQRLVSLIHRVIKSGYKAVVAPAWGLNPDITHIWLAEFLERLKSGVSLGIAVQHSNLHVAKSGFTDVSGFYYPAGWAAMHLYGNPNIHFETLQNQ